MWRARKLVHCPENNVLNSGITKGCIAFLDTGIEDHPDLNIEKRLLAFKDFVHGNKYCYDDSGHGTHVCGIACGTGKSSYGYYRGIAPEVKFMMGKILDKSGNGLIEHMIKGLEWILVEKNKYDIKVLNISIGINEIRDMVKVKSLLNVIQYVSDAGVLVVCAAGNNGPKEGSMSMIGNLEDIIIVGCHDGLSEFRKGCNQYSARGNPYSRIKKPDIVAPGTHIISCNKKYKKRGNKIFQPYIAKNGTSMATPMVSGAAMSYLQTNPDAPNCLIKQKILDSATDLGEHWTKQGKGMLNISKMLEL